MSVSVLARLDSEMHPFPFACKTETAAPDLGETESTLALRRTLLSMKPEDIPAFAEAHRAELRPHKFHVHDHAQITLCKAGTIIYLFDSNAVILEAGDIMMLNPMVPHSWIPVSPEGARCQIGFYPEMLRADHYNQAFFPYFRLLYSQSHPVIRVTASGPYYDRLRSSVAAIEEACFERFFSYDSLVHMHLMTFSEYLLLSLPEFSGMTRLAENRSIVKALDYIELHLPEDFSSADVAAHVGLNTSYFSTYFKKHLGVSFKQYVITNRIAKAASLLQYSDKSITAILYECGFSSISVFYSAFHKTYAMSPDSFRKLHRVGLKEKG